MTAALNLAVKRCLMLAMVLTAWVLPLQCATLERLSLDDMITRSTTIVRGKVTASWAAFTGSVIYTHYQIQVSEQFKGASQNSVEVMTPGGTVKGLHLEFRGVAGAESGRRIRVLPVDQQERNHLDHRSHAGAVFGGARRPQARTAWQRAPPAAN